MLKQQTICMKIDMNVGTFEIPDEKNPEESVFTETPFDIKIEEFMETLASENLVPVQKSVIVSGEYITAIIDYIPVSEIPNQNIITPQKIPAIVV